MLDPTLLRNRLPQVAESLQTRGVALPVAEIEALEAERKRLQTRAQELQNLRNTRSKAIGAAKGRGEDVSALMAEVAGFADELRADEASLAAVQDRLAEIALGLPNLPQASVPVGRDETQNVELRRKGEPRKFDFEPKDHVELGRPQGLAGRGDGGKALRGTLHHIARELARMHRALAQFMLDLHVREHGYLEVNVPLLVNADSLRGTGQLPKFEDDLFSTSTGEVKRYLIPTAEVPLTNMVRDSILEAAELPLRMVAVSMCFRAEAGSYGKDVRGIVRQHQFEKVELVSVTRPDASDEEHERMTRCAERVLELLGLPYRTVLLCTGDMGFSASKTYDLEVWLPAQGTYREISSCSNCETFQARRMQARWRNPETGRPELVHTLNGSGVAVGRALLMVMENSQNADGSITVPEVLRPYMGGTETIA